MTPRTTTARVSQGITAIPPLAWHFTDAPEAGAVTGQVMLGAGRQGRDWLVKVYDTENNLLGSEAAQVDGSFLVALDREPVTRVLVVRVTLMNHAANDALVGPVMMTGSPGSFQAVTAWDGGTVHVQLSPESGTLTPEVEALPLRHEKALPVLLAVEAEAEALPAPEPAPAPEPVLVLVVDPAREGVPEEGVDSVWAVRITDASGTAAGHLSARIKLPELSMLGGGAVSAWFHFEWPHSMARQQMFELASVHGALAGLFVQGGRLHLENKKGAVVACTEEGWQLSSGWHHVLIQTSDAVGWGASTTSTWSVHVDGEAVLVQENVRCLALALSTQRSNQWRVTLGNAVMGSRPLMGWVRQVRVWNAVLSADDVRRDMGGLSELDARLKACWDLDVDLCNAVPRGASAVLLGAARLADAPFWAEKFVSVSQNQEEFQSWQQQ